MHCAEIHLRRPVAERREAIGRGAIVGRFDFEIIDLAAGVYMKGDRFATDERERFHLMQVVTKFAKQKRCRVNRDRQVLALVRAKDHRAAGRRARSSFLKSQQVFCFEHVHYGVQRMRSRHRVLRPQRRISKQ